MAFDTVGKVNCRKVGGDAKTIGDCAAALITRDGGLHSKRSIGTDLL
jgi:hypothetical protein